MVLLLEYIIFSPGLFFYTEVLGLLVGQSRDMCWVLPVLWMIMMLWLNKIPHCISVVYDVTFAHNNNNDNNNKQICIAP